MEGKEKWEGERCIYCFLKVIANHINAFITGFIAFLGENSYCIHKTIRSFSFCRLCFKIRCHVKPGKFCTSVCTNTSAYVDCSESNDFYLFPWNLQQLRRAQ